MNNFYSKKVNSYLNNFSSYNLGFISLNIGIFFLFSAPILASFLLIVSLALSFSFIRENIINDKLNIFLIFISLLMIFSILLFQLGSQEKILQYKPNFNTPPWISLINWIPLFFSYLGFQYYLKGKKRRIICCISLVCGSIPVLISGYGQYLFGWYGPLQFLNGLIIWYQRENSMGMTSLFNNQNYASCALATVYPFLTASLFTNKKFNIQKIITLILTLLVIIGIFFTTSRNGLLCLILGTFILLIPLRSKLKLFFISIFSFSSILLCDFIFKSVFQFPIIPLKLVQKMQFDNFIYGPRIIIWEKALSYISEKPIFGWGGNSFSSLWNDGRSEYFGHSHSIPIEIAIQYGLITSIFLSFIIIYLFFKSFKSIFLNNNKNIINFNKNNHYDRAWFASSFIIIFSNMIDILYYDFRISILTWILLAGLRNISQEIEHIEA